ncbi:hypothetical protein GALL_134740 [mine drainage metagenome]|uniref:(5-formylfuran-3-yl)methyl phosphate synthase n=1 Tax=mine drainage metagenome TaxID=410659 RepID=A0A1J5S8S5_9ZZZZ
MTQLLISVTSIEEAQIALENGADIIDLKDPAAGALGALPLSKIQAVVDYVNGIKLVSATIGDLPMQPDLILQQVIALVNAKVDIVKIGFFETDDYQPCLDVLLSLTQKGIKLIAVLFAEHTYSTSLIDDIKNAGFIGVMLDTAKKNGSTLLDYYSEAQRMSFSQRILALGLSYGLAGSLRLEHVATVQKMHPTYIGFRGGVCAENRRQLSLNGAKIKEIRNVL